MRYAACFAAGFMVAFLGLAFIIDPVQNGVAMERERAIKAGAAEWQISPQTGERAFVYKLPKP